MDTYDLSELMQSCSGTEEEPHPTVFFFSPASLTCDTVGHCPVCVVLQHVVPVQGYQAGNFGPGVRKGRLEVKRGQ